MAVHSIKYFTKSVIALLEEGFREAGFPNVSVFPDPPAKEKDKGIGFYLFHITESPHHNNFPPPGKDQPSVLYSPMGLNLYYQLTANFDNRTNDGTDAYEEQDMMSIAMNILHGYPEINDNTKINGVNIFDQVEGIDTVTFEPDIQNRNNRIKISLLPVTHNEAVHYWTAGQMPMKCAAYYEVCHTFLEPKKTKTYAGRVLQYGNFVFPEGAPRITQSQNILEFALPAGDPQKITVQPAQAPYEDTIDFFGAGFSGDIMELLLSHGRWDNPVRANDWELAIIKEGHIRVKVKDHAVKQEDGATVDVLPGLYAAQIRVARSRVLPAGTVRQFSHTSNQFPITVSPQVGTPNLAGGVITVNGKIFQHADLKEEDVEAYLGEIRFPRDSALSDGTFRTTGPETIEIKLPASYPDSWASRSISPCASWSTAPNRRRGGYRSPEALVRVRFSPAAVAIAKACLSRSDLSGRQSEVGFKARFENWAKAYFATQPSPSNSPKGRTGRVAIIGLQEFYTTQSGDVTYSYRRR